MDQKLKDKIALVTGASGGQGAAEARLFAPSGARVIRADVQDDKGEAEAKSIRDAGGDAQYRHLDVADQDNWQQVIDGIARTTARSTSWSTTPGWHCVAGGSPIPR